MIQKYNYIFFIEKKKYIIIFLNHYIFSMVWLRFATRIRDADMKRIRIQNTACIEAISLSVHIWIILFLFFSSRQENFDILSCMQFSEIFKRQLYSQCSCCKVLLWIPISHFRWTLTPICEKYAGVYQTLWQSQIFKKLLFFEEVVWEHLRYSGRRIENFVCKQLCRHLVVRTQTILIHNITNFLNKKLYSVKQSDRNSSKTDIFH